jgi:hypothetical protein
MESWSESGLERLCGAEEARSKAERTGDDFRGHYEVSLVTKIDWKEIEEQEGIMEWRGGGHQIIDVDIGRGTRLGGPDKLSPNPSTLT